jgi:hypothetical protein
MNDALDVQARRPTCEPPHDPRIARRAYRPPVLPPLANPRRTAVPPPLPAAARKAGAAPIRPNGPRVATPSYSDIAETKRMPKASFDALKRIHSLLESLNALRSASTAWQVAGGCAAVMARTLDARAVVVHQHDERAHELRVIGIHAADGEGLLGSVASTGEDFVAMNVLASGTTMRVRIDGELPELAPHRLRALGTSRSVIAVPVMRDGACVALIELVDVEEQCEPLVKEVCTLLTEHLLRVLAPAG